MICPDVRQYLYAFLDNELDAKLSMEMQQHLEHCPVCARECEIENAVRRQLSEELQKSEHVPAFDESALLRLIDQESAVQAPSPQRRPRYWRLGAAGAIAAALLFSVTLFVTNRTDESEHVPLADALVDDFDHFVTKGKPLQIVSSDAQVVSDWLRDRTALAVSIPLVDPAIGTLMGGRKCKINGKPAAFAVYRVGDELVSMVALAESDEAVASMKRIERNGHAHWIDHCRGHTVLACRRGELIYAIISRLTEETLSPLMPPAES